MTRGTGVRQTAPNARIHPTYSARVCWRRGRLEKYVEVPRGRPIWYLGFTGEVRRTLQGKSTSVHGWADKRFLKYCMDSATNGATSTTQ